MSDDNLYSTPEDHPERDLVWLETEFIPQSLQFMVDLLPTIRKLTKGWPRDKILEVFDVGTGSGAGANFLAMLHRSKFFGAQMTVDAIDIDPRYKKYAERNFKDINSYMVGDIFTINTDSTWDLITCSATVEHLKPDYLRDFLQELQRRSRHWVVIYTSFEEQHLLDGEHLISFNKELIDSFEPVSVKITESIAWKNPADKVSKVVIFVLKGKALTASTATSEEQAKIAEIRTEVIDKKCDYESAIKELAPLIEKLPANGTLNYLMGFCLHSLNKDLDGAVNYYDKALQSGFSQFWVLYARGSLYYKLGNYRAARIDLEKALLLNPLHEGAQIMLKRIAP